MNLRFRSNPIPESIWRFSGSIMSHVFAPHVSVETKLALNVWSKNCAYHVKLWKYFDLNNMDFVVDKVSEDSFYENLLLGLPKILEDFPLVSEPYLSRSLPVQHNIIYAWEQKNTVLLPEDLRCFYGSTDGILYSYKYQLKDLYGENALEGKIEINSIENLSQINEYEICGNPGVNMDSERYILKLGLESKVFVLADLDGHGKVVLVYINSRYFPNIWIQTSTNEFYFLSDDFTTYLRMSIHHLGISFWQFAYTDYGLPEFSKMFFRLTVPDILPLDGKIEENRKKYEFPLIEDLSSAVISNKIDLDVFRSYFRVTPPNVSNIIEKTNASLQSKKKPNSRTRSLTAIVRKTNSKK